EPWIPVSSGSSPTPVPEASPADEAALARARGDATAAARELTAAEARLERAKQDIAASDARLAGLAEADEARDRAWRGEMHQSGNRYLAVAGAAGVAAAASLGVGFFFVARGDAIESGKRSYPTIAERDAASRHARVSSLTSFVVALPIAIVGIVAAHYA